MMSGGAQALSILTQPYLFNGSPEYFIKIRKNVKIPLLMKDVMIDKIQIDAAKKMGADYFLLIQALFDKGFVDDIDELIDYGHENDLKILFEKVRDYKDVKLKFDNWSNYLEIVYGETQKEKNLFFKHTYLSTLVKLLIHLKISSTESKRSDEILPILLGKRFAQYGIINFSEEDFFTWTMSPFIRKQSSQIFSKLLAELARYDIDAINEDVLKELYHLL